MNNTGMQSKIPLIHPEAVIREEFDDWALLFDPTTGNTFGMNPVTVNIVKNIDGNRTVSDIITCISEVYEDVPETVGEDIEQVLDDLVKTGMVSWKSD